MIQERERRPWRSIPIIHSVRAYGRAIISADCVPLGMTKNEKQFSGAHYRHPNGLTSSEIAERLGATAGNISSRLSKLAAYGIIAKTHYRRGPRGNIYRALTDEQAAM